MRSDTFASTEFASHVEHLIVYSFLLVFPLLEQTNRTPETPQRRSFWEILIMEIYKMKIERFIALLILPNIAMAKGGGIFIIGFIIFLPLFFWGMVKIWKFWFKLIFGGLRTQNTNPQPTQISNTNNSTKECPYCAETIQLKAVKCRHCGSNLWITKNS